VWKLNVVLVFFLSNSMAMSCTSREWPRLWTAYTMSFMDGQIRVIDRDSGDRTTSEGQAYAMFFSLVANDRERFDKLLRWTELNLTAGALSSQLPAWLWGRGADNRWAILDDNSASDADVWMAYTLFEAGSAWSVPRYTQIAESLATRIANEETAQLPNVGTMLIPGARGFRAEGSVRLNASYLPLQLFVGLRTLHQSGPWDQIAKQIPALVRASSPRGFATDWIEITDEGRFTPSSQGSYDAIRTYLWAGMLDPATPGRDEMLNALAGMARLVRDTRIPPATITADGVTRDPKGPVGFSAALLPYLDALGETRLSREQFARVQSSRDAGTGLLGRPAKYYDQNLALFALGAREGVFWFDARGRLKTKWMLR
jgi:endoglucanase